MPRYNNALPLVVLLFSLLSSQNVASADEATPSSLPTLPPNWKPGLELLDDPAERQARFMLLPPEQRNLPVRVVNGRFLSYGDDNYYSEKDAATTVLKRVVPDFTRSNQVDEVGKPIPPVVTKDPLSLLSLIEPLDKIGGRVKTDPNLFRSRKVASAEAEKTKSTELKTKYLGLRNTVYTKRSSDTGRLERTSEIVSGATALDCLKHSLNVFVKEIPAMSVRMFLGYPSVNTQDASDAENLSLCVDGWSVATPDRKGSRSGMLSVFSGDAFAPEALAKLIPPASGAVESIDTSIPTHQRMIQFDSPAQFVHVTNIGLLRRYREKRENAVTWRFGIDEIEHMLLFATQFPREETGNFFPLIIAQKTQTVYQATNINVQNELKRIFGKLLEVGSSSKEMQHAAGVDNGDYFKSQKFNDLDELLRKTPSYHANAFMTTPSILSRVSVWVRAAIQMVDEEERSSASADVVEAAMGQVLPLLTRHVVRGVHENRRFGRPMEWKRGFSVVERVK